MSMMSLFDAFEAMDVSVERPKDTAKEEKQAPKKSAGVKQKAKKKSDAKISLPANIYGRNFHKVIAAEGANELPESEVLLKLAEAGIKEAEMSGVGLYKIPAADNSYFFGLSREKNTDIFHGIDSPLTQAVDLTKPVVVAMGEYIMEVTSDKFSGKENGEVSVADVLQVFAESNPEYASKDVTAFYDAETNIVSPLFDGKSFYIKSDVELPLTIGAPDVRVTYTESDFEESQIKSGKVSVAAVLRKFLGVELVADPKDINTLNSVLSLCTAETSDEVIYDVRITVGTKGLSSDSGKPKKAEKKVQLPVKIVLYEIDRKFELTSANFAGKDKVSQDEIKKAVGQEYEYINDRTVWYYDSQTNTMSARNSVSGKKG